MNKETYFGAGNVRMGMNMDIQLNEEIFLTKERRPIDEKAGYSLMQFGNFVNKIAEGMTLNYDVLLENEDYAISQLDKIGGPDYANDINAWMNLVIPESSLPKTEIREVSGARIVLDPSVNEIPTDIDKEYSAESILIGVAIAEAKLLVVSQLMKDVYPALAVDAKKKLDELHATSEQILKAKENDKTLKFSLSGGLKGGVNKKVVPLLVIGSFVLAACVGSVSAGDGVPTAVALESTKTPIVNVVEATATKTEIPTATATPTMIPPTETPAPTEMPTATETPEIEVKDFGVCSIEKFRDCVITVEELFNGEYLKFLRTLSEPFDPSTFKDPLPPLIRHGFFGIEYSQDTAPNFPNGGTPFRKHRTSGVVIGKDGKLSAIMAVEYPDPKDPTNKDKNVWVLMEQNLYYVECAATKAEPMTEGEIQTYLIRAWKEMNIVVTVTNMYNETNGVKEADPIVQRTFEENPDMSSLFDKFAAGDTTALDGKVVKTFMTIGYGPFE